MTHPPRFDLERLLAEEISGEQAAELRSHLDSCAACQLLMTRLESEQARLLAEKPPAVFVAGLGERAPAGVRRLHTHVARWRMWL